MTIRNDVNKDLRQFNPIVLNSENTKLERNKASVKFIFSDEGRVHYILAFDGSFIPTEQELLNPE